MLAVRLVGATAHYAAGRGEAQMSAATVVDRTQVGAWTHTHTGTRSFYIIKDMLFFYMKKTKTADP